MKLRSALFGLLSILVVGAAGTVGCGSSTSSSGGKGGSGGGAGSGGASGAGGGGTDAGSTGAGGHGGSGGAGGGSGGSAGTGGAGGSAAGGSGGGTADAGQDANRDTSTNRDGTSTDGASTLTLTSTGFTEGMMIPAANTCAGANTSPALAWTAGPAGTMSYAIVLTDLSNNLVHWVIWDIPAGTLSLPAMLAGDAMLASPAGAKQVHVSGTGNGYYGPCPMGNTHTYQFEVHALGVATLGGVTTTSSTSTVKAAVLAGSLGHGDLTGMSNARMM
jgi:Raf kinase inhibitor-like YbhB/YbcL family protein